MRKAVESTDLAKSSRPVRRLLGWFAGMAWMLSSAAGPATGATATVSKQPFAGVIYSHRTLTVPRPLSIHLLEIDLTNPDIAFLMSPSNGSAPGENAVQRTRDFVANVGAQLGVNASFYYWHGGGDGFPAGYYNRGVVASQGDIYSYFDTGPQADYNPMPTLNLSATNVATILAHSQMTPSTPLNNAASGSEQHVTNGVNTAGQFTFAQPTQLHPRTVAGITADQKLILMVVDGRQSGFSEGMTNSETADLLIQYGVVNAVNLDGGGSSTMVMAQPTAQTINRPSQTPDRSVATSLAVFAAPATQQWNLITFADFYAGERSTFSFSPTTSGSTRGVLSTSSNTVVQSSAALERGWFQRLTIHNDPAQNGGVEHPSGGWFVRHISGSSATQSQNIPRPTTGWVGFWARTEVEGIETALAIDDAHNTTADRGVKRPLIADGQWHLYQWNLENTDHWEPWVNGNGMIDTASFTLDSIQFFGPNADALIDLDMISHNAFGTLPRPSTLPVSASHPLPAHGAVGANPMAILRWTAGDKAITHRVYFGISHPLTYRGLTSETSYDPGPLDRMTLHYWRIDAVNELGTTTGDLWTFTTGGAPGDFDGDGDVDLEDFGYLQRCYGGSGIPAVPGCEDADLDGDGDVDINDFNLFRNCMGGADRPPGC